MIDGENYIDGCCFSFQEIEHQCSELRLALKD